MVLALLGGGGWYGWKMTHPAEDGTGTGTKITDGSGRGETVTGEKVDWIKKGDDARDAGNYHDAVKSYRQGPASAKTRIVALQPLVEADVTAKVTKLSDLGQFDQADALIDDWLADFPESTILPAQKALIARRRAAQ